MKRIVLFAFGFCIVTIVWWLNGFNFDTRGPELAAWFAISIAAGLLSQSFVSIDGDE